MALNGNRSMLLISSFHVDKEDIVGLELYVYTHSSVESLEPSSYVQFDPAISSNPDGIYSDCK